jgi:hypothetical protein
VCCPGPGWVHLARRSQLFSPLVQGLTEMAQLIPSQPATQAQVYASTASAHVAPFLHGRDKHSLTSCGESSRSEVQSLTFDEDGSR